MTITAQMVQDLRNRTGARLMECKKALEATSGDIDAAIEVMRKSGQAQADKKAGRVAAEGVILIKVSTDQKVAIILEINCETDFVARDEQFKQFAEAAANAGLQARARDGESLQKVSIGNQTVEDARKALVSKIGENIQIRRVALIEAKGMLASYLHGGRIGVLVDCIGGDTQLGKDLAMHIAANTPLVVNPNQVPADIIAKEKEIFIAQAQNTGKPAAIIEKMTEGRMKKFLDEVSLLGQPFVKDPSVTVNQLLDQKNAKVSQFIRFGVGEGIEKQTENFVDAVMAQVRGA